MKSINKIIGSLNLPEELQEQLSSAWNEAVQENKAEAVREIREEYENHYKNEVKTMVEAADSLINETLESELSEFNADRQKMFEAKKALLRNLKKSRMLKEQVEKKSKARVEVLEKMVLETLKGELKEFTDDRAKLEESLNNERIELAKEKMKAKKLSESQEKALNTFISETLREELVEFNNDRKEMLESLGKMENIVVRQLTEELSEFQEDRKQLQERKNQLETEFKEKLEEAKKVFIKKASKSAEAVINETLHSELTSLKEDIKQAKENTFGRKLFEAFATEFYYSHLSENTELSKLNKKLQSSSQNVEKLQKIVKEQQETINKSKKDLLETRKTYEKQNIISGLVSSLSGVQKRMMTQLLEGVEVKDLKTTFEKYLPTVLEKNSSDIKKSDSRTVMNENKQKKQKTYSQANGSRNLSEKHQRTILEDVSDEEINKIILQAGINNKK